VNVKESKGSGVPLIGAGGIGSLSMTNFRTSLNGGIRSGAFFNTLDKNTNTN
jgi:hypothetical protein